MCLHPHPLQRDVEARRARDDDLEMVGVERDFLEQLVDENASLVRRRSVPDGNGVEIRQERDDFLEASRQVVVLALEPFTLSGSGGLDLESVCGCCITEHAPAWAHPAASAA